MQQTCVYEAMALGYSQFCGLFTEKEWEGFAYRDCRSLRILPSCENSYSAALSMWYGAGPGSPLSAALGVGWVQELVFRKHGSKISTRV